MATKKTPKSAVRKPVARKSAAGAKTFPAPGSVSAAPAGSPVTPEERHRRIAEAAYYIALQRGFESDPHANWLEAERQIDAQIKSDKA